MTFALKAKGFGPDKPAPRAKSDGQVKREGEASKYDELSSTGGQEYNIFVRQFGGEDTSWLPAGKNFSLLLVLVEGSNKVILLNVL